MTSLPPGKGLSALLDRARQRLELRFATPPSANLFEGVPSVVESQVHGANAIILVEGPVGPAMESALKGPTLLRVGSAGDDLEDLFRSLYERRDAED
jgi:hypothetical protein